MNDLNLQPSQVFSLFETNKAERVKLCDSIVGDLELGFNDPLKIQSQIKMLEDIINTLTNTDSSKNKNADIAKRYKALVMDAAQKYGQKFELHNASFSVGEVGVRYDFSMCGDPFMEQYLSDKEIIDTRVKERQDFLKTVPPSGMDIFDPGTAEVVRVYPPSKSGTTALKTTLK